MATNAKPFLTGGSHTLPFEKLAPLEFERLCLWLVTREGYERAEHLGEAGSEGGRDVVAWKGGRRVVFQCKRVKAFTAAHAKKEIEKLRRLPAEEQPQELVFVVSQAVSAETRQAARVAWGDEESCQFWTGSELDRRVKQHEELLEEFFQLPAEGRRSARARSAAWGWGVGISILGVVLTVAAWLWPLASGPAEVQKMLLVSRDTKEHPLEGFQFAYEGGKSPPTSDTGTTELKLPPKHTPGQKIKVLLLSAPKKEEDWFLVNPLVNIPVPSISAEVVLMRRGEFRAFAAEARDAAGRYRTAQGEQTVDERKRALLEVATHYGLTAEKLDAAIRAFGESQDPKDKGIAAYLEGQYSKAETLLNEAAERKERDYIETLRYLGASQYEQAKYSAAAATFRKALALGGEDSALLYRLGTSLFELAEWGEAETLLRRALRIDEHNKGPEHLDATTGLSSLALLLDATNRPEEAETLMRRALAIDEMSRGSEHAAVARDLANLAVLLMRSKRFAEAEPLLRRAARIYKVGFGEEHPFVARAINNLAYVLENTGRAGEAEALLRRALEISETSLGPRHPHVAVHLNNLAGLLQGMNRLAEAEPLIRRALDITEATFGPEHPNVAVNLNTLALLVERTRGRFEAEPLARRSLEILLANSRRAGHDHPNLRIVLGNYWSLLRAMGRTNAEIEAVFKELNLTAGSPSADP